MFMFMFIIIVVVIIIIVPAILTDKKKKRNNNIPPSDKISINKETDLKRSDIKSKVVSKEKPKLGATIIAQVTDTNIFRGYNNPYWKNKREQILERDNYTCQCCKIINPSKGLVFIDRENNNYEIHEYQMHGTTYSIYSSIYGIKVILKFGDSIRMPILQIHHEKYIRHRQLWEYDNSDLITLCKKCHEEKHRIERIPIFPNDKCIEPEGYIEEIEPDSFNADDNTNIPAWSIIDRNKNFVNSFKIDLKIAYLSLDKENSTIIAEKKAAAINIALKFLEKNIPSFNFIADPITPVSSSMVLEPSRIEMIQKYSQNNSHIYRLDCEFNFEEDEKDENGISCWGGGECDKMTYRETDENLKTILDNEDFENITFPIYIFGKYNPITVIRGDRLQEKL